MDGVLAPDRHDRVLETRSRADRAVSYVDLSMLPRGPMTLFLGWDGKVHLNNPRFMFGYALCGYFHEYPLRASRHAASPTCPGCQGRQQTWEDLPYG